METNLEIIQPDAMAQLQRAETETAVDIAKRYPRDLAKAKKTLLFMGTVDEDTAKSCFYKKPVDNKGTLVEGPSIRMAEIAVNCYGNIRYGSRVIEESEKWVKVQGVCFDLENNLSYAADVQRSIWSESYNKRYSQNLIQTTIKAAAAIAVRDAVFKIVALGMFSSELKQIKAKATGRGSDIPLPKRIENAFAYFKKIGVDEKKIFERLEVRDKTEITEDHLETLVGLKTGIEDKEFTIEEAFVPYKKEAKENKERKVSETMSNIAKEAKKDDPSRVPPEDIA